MFNDSNTFYSQPHPGGTIFRHGNRNYQRFYGRNYSHVLDVIGNAQPIAQKVFTGLNIDTDVEIYDNNTRRYRLLPNAFFNKCVFYNSSQSTGLRPVSHKSSTFVHATDQSNTIYAFRSGSDRTWSLSTIRDLVEDHPDHSIFSSAWTDIQSAFPIDKVPNPLATNTAKSQFERAKFKDKFIGARLYFDSENAMQRISTNLLTIKAKISHR